MKDEEILEKAIEKAVGNGWDELDRDADKIPFGGVDKKGKYAGKYLKYKTVSRVRYLYENVYSVIFKSKCGDELDFFFHPFQYIFSHDFAKAFFGEKMIWKGIPTVFGNGVVNYGLPAWQFHLRDMVIEKEPLKYLEKYL